MTFWYVFWNRLNFFELLFSFGIDHDPPCFLCSHDLCLFLFPMFHSSHDHNGQEKSLLYYDLFDFRVLLYGHIPTFIFLRFLHNPTTPILPVYVDQRQSYLEKDTSRP